MRSLLRTRIERCDGADLRRRAIALLLVLMTQALADLRLSAQEVGETVVRSGVVADDLYPAGGRVHVVADARGDVVAAGGRVMVGERVAGDVIAAGGAVEVRGHVGDDVRMPGGQLVLAGDQRGEGPPALRPPRSGPGTPRAGGRDAEWGWGEPPAPRRPGTSAPAIRSLSRRCDTRMNTSPLRALPEAH